MLLSTIVFFSRPTSFVMTEFYRQFIQFVQFTLSVFFSTHCAERFIVIAVTKLKYRPTFNAVHVQSCIALLHF